MSRTYHSGNGLNLFDFNNVTGVVSNPSVSVFTASSPYGIEFSPNDSILYTGCVWGGSSSVRQISTSNPANTFTVATMGSNQQYGKMALAPNGRIYVARGPGNTSTSIGVINNPNNWGATCNFVQNGFALSPGSFSFFGMPVFQKKFVYINNPSLYSVSANDTCLGSPTQFFLNTSSSYDSIAWIFGDIGSGTANFSSQLSPQHIYSSSGTFQAEVRIYSCSVDTMHITVNVTPGLIFGLGADTSFCLGESTLLYPGPGFSSYDWSDGTHDSTLSVNATGNYWLRASNSGGCFSVDSILISIIDTPQVLLPADTNICYSQSFQLANQSPVSGQLEMWSTGQQGAALTVNSSGTYFLIANNSCGSDTDSVSIQFSTLVAPDLGTDSAFCESDTVILSGGTYPFYQWNNGTSQPTLNVTQTGLFILTVSDSLGCDLSDSVSLQEILLPHTLLPADTIVCNFQPFQISNQNPVPGQIEIWSNGQAGGSLTVNGSGNYGLTASNVCGADTDSVSIQVSSFASPYLGPDSSLCENDTVLLSAGTYPFYNWSDGSSQSFLAASTGGTYILTVSDSLGCSLADSIILQETLLPLVSLASDTDICMGSPFVILGNSRPGAGNAIWSTGFSGPNLTVSALEFIG